MSRVEEDIDNDAVHTVPPPTGSHLTLPEDSDGDEDSSSQVHKKNESTVTTTRSQIETLLKQKDDSVSLVKQKNTTSTAWNNFRRVELNKQSTDYVVCVSCQKVLKQNRTTGTSILKAHKCTVSKSTAEEGASSSPINKFLMKKVPARVKEELTIALGKWCSENYRPYSIAEDAGFRDIAAMLMKVGALYGACTPVEEVVPAATTVARHILKIGDEIKAKLKLHLIQYPGPKSFTTDHWKSKINQSNFQTTTLHFIELAENGDWHVVDRAIGASALDERKTAENIRERSKDVLEEFGLSYGTSTWTTDNASNVIAAFRMLKWNGCGAHDLALCVDEGFAHLSREAREADTTSEIMNLITAAKSVTTYCKKSSVQRRLVDEGVGLKQEVETRWNSLLGMLKSIKKALPHLRIILQELSRPGKTHSQLNNVNRLDTPLLEQVISILQPFETATELFSQATKPTLHLKATTKISILKELDNKLDSLLNDSDDNDEEIHDGSSQDLVRFVQGLKIGVDAKLKINLLHKAASLMHPKFKSLMISRWSTEELEQVKEYIRTTLFEDFTGFMANNRSFNIWFETESGSKKIDDPHPQKKLKVSEDDFFSDLLTTPDGPETLSTQEEINELEEYIKLKHHPVLDVMKYWSRNTTFPKLREVAYYLFAIPVSSVSSERLGSLLTLTLQARRGSLDPDRVDSMVVIKGNKDLK